MAIVAFFSILGKSQHFQIEVVIKKTFLHFEIWSNCKLPSQCYSAEREGLSQCYLIMCEKICFSFVSGEYPDISLSVANIQENLCTGPGEVKVMGLPL